MTPLEGLLVLDKPAGPTSHDVVEAVRRLAMGAKVGHAGTLDPFATGVLPLLLGRATRLSRYLSAERKTYAGTLTLGVATDTYDREGSIVSTSDAGSIAEETIREAGARFSGRILQTPPIYSARRISGRRLHRLARKGEAPLPAPSWVEIHRFEFLEFDSPRVRFIAETSAGTYIRSLAHDLGADLGCGAHLTELRRVRSGRLEVAQAHTLEAVESAASEGRLGELIVPMGLIDLGLPTVRVRETGRDAMRSGRPLTADLLAGPWPDASGTPRPDPHAVRVLDLSGNLLGVALESRIDGAPPRLSPQVVLVA